MNSSSTLTMTNDDLLHIPRWPAGSVLPDYGEGGLLGLMRNIGHYLDGHPWRLPGQQAERQPKVLVLNKATPDQAADLPSIAGLPQQRISMPDLEPLRARQLRSGSVLGLGDETEKMLDNFCASLLQKIEGESVQRG